MARKNKKRVPFSAGKVAPRSGKKITSGGHLKRYERSCITWRIGRLQYKEESLYSWRMSADKLIEVVQKLGGWEGSSLDEILGRNSHEVKVEQLAKEAQKEMVRLKIDDVESLLSLRLRGKERIWGIRRGQVVELLWWDPEHEVCPSTLRHT